MNHATGAVAPPDTEVIQVGDAIRQRAQRRGPVGCQYASPYRELGFPWQCDEDPALLLNTFK